MKGNKYRRCHQWMQQTYEKGFSLRRPYQILLDDTFLSLSQRHQVDLKKKLELIMGNDVRLMVTGCVMNSLKNQSKAVSQSSANLVVSDDSSKIASHAYLTHNMARSLELRRCRHEKDPKSVEECFKSLIGDDNPFHYCVATASEDLKKIVRLVAGIPLLYFERVFPLLEAPTSLTRKRMAEIEKEKFSSISMEEMKRIKNLLPIGDNVDDDIVKYKKRRAKAPNPLSLKKKKSITKVIIPTVAISENNKSIGVETTSPSSLKKRKRRKKSKSSGPMSQ